MSIWVPFLLGHPVCASLCCKSVLVLSSLLARETFCQQSHTGLYTPSRKWSIQELDVFFMYIEDLDSCITAYRVMVSLTSWEFHSIISVIDSCFWTQKLKDSCKELMFGKKHRFFHFIKIV